MHLWHKPYDHGLSIRVHKFPTTEEIMTRFPHVVHHDARLSSLQWYQMRKWLDAHVGPHDEAWTWLMSSEIRFCYESDAMLFSLTWS